MIICISSWDKYNPRKRGDTKSASWFRCQNGFITDPDFFDYSSDQKMVWIYLLSQASAKLSAEIKINPSLVASILRVDAALVSSTIESFQDKGFLKIVAQSPQIRSEPAANPQQSRGATDGRTDVTNEQKRAKALSPENREKRPSRKPLEPRYEPCDMALAKRWLDHAHTLTPHLKADLSKWADSVRLIREQDGLTLDEVTKVFEWVKQDEFWRMNAISPQAIRGRSKNGLKKIENIRLRMQETPAAETPEEWAARMDKLIAEGKLK